jgi:hypothetical protein
LEIVDDKLATSRALRWYARREGIDLPLIPEAGLPAPDVPVDADALDGKAEAALDRLAADGIDEVVVKPVRGEQARGVGCFRLPQDRLAAAAHAARLALESGAVIQKRIRSPGEDDYTWRVLVALGPDGEPTPVGRFARRVVGDDVEMVPEREMLWRSGVGDRDAQRLLSRLNEISVHAFHAVKDYARARRGDFPWRPLGGGSYAVPYFLGIDLIGDARIMEVNGNEVAGMWTDDRLHPETRGRSSRQVLAWGERAGRAYRRALEAFC